MRLLIEGYRYDVADVIDVLDGLLPIQDVKGKTSVDCVGYYYNPKLKDMVFVLPKVLIDEAGYLFGKYDPRTFINLDASKLDAHEAKFIYEFSVWIYRAIVVYNNTHERNNIILRPQMEGEGSGAKKQTATWLDVILSLIRFSNENRSFLTFVLRNIHSGYNKINWTRTISGTAAVVQDDSPVYLNPVNKKRQVNFDEELIVIFLSILQYVSERFGFKTDIPYGFPLIKGAKFERYISGYGCHRLRQIKYKYYSDVATRLWHLCYVFFDKAYQIKTSATNNEYLIAKSFHVVFEAMIDELIGNDDVPSGLQAQYDDKLVDHFYTGQGLLVDRPDKNDIYYIGDSKYYRIGSTPGSKSVYKQYTYARNVIQWNINLYDFDTDELPEERAKRILDLGKYALDRPLRDPVTEGYNVIPNFFISAFIPQNADGSADLTYRNEVRLHAKQPPVNCQFRNRLYDRDTLIISHYDVNFLYILMLYARDSAPAKAVWKNDIRRRFRNEIQQLLQNHFSFYAMTARPDVDTGKWFRDNFRQVIGKTYSPFLDNDVFSLALDKAPQYKDENEALIASLQESFYVVPCTLGSDPTAQTVMKQYADAVSANPDPGAQADGASDPQLRIHFPDFSD